MSITISSSVDAVAATNWATYHTTHLPAIIEALINPTTTYQSTYNWTTGRTNQCMAAWSWSSI